MLGRQRPAAALLTGLDIATSILPDDELKDWLLADGDLRWGTGGVIWSWRVAEVAVFGSVYAVPANFWEAGQGFTREQNKVACRAVLRAALAYLQGRPSASLFDDLDAHAPASGNLTTD